MSHAKENFLNAYRELYETCRREYLSHLRENHHPASHYPTSISNGMISGTVCDGDADCGDASGAESAPSTAADGDDGGGGTDGSDPDPAPRQQNNTHPSALAPLSADIQRRPAAVTAGNHPPPPLDPAAKLWKPNCVLAHVPVCRTAWYQGVKSGRFPQPVKLVQRGEAWKASEIRSFITSL